MRLIFKLADGTLSRRSTRGALGGAIVAVAGDARARPPVAAEHVSARSGDTTPSSAPSDMTLHAAPLVFDSATAADQAVARLIAEQPELFGAVQVVPGAQVRRAA